MLYFQLMVALLLTVVQAPVSPSERAATLFRDAREAIDSVEATTSIAGLSATDVSEQMRAGLWLELAKSEVVAFPDAAAADAEAAMQHVRALPGGGRDFDQSRASDPAARPALLGWMAKAQIEPEIIRLLVFVKHNARAVELARTTDIAHSDLYDPILRGAEPGDILKLAAECRAADGSYPYIAIADRARTIADAAARRSLLEAAYASVAQETEFKYRSLAFSLVERTYDLMPPDTVARVLTELMQQMIANPTTVTGGPQAGGASTDRDFFGPQIIELLMEVDPVRAAAMASDHPNWEAQRKIPGRTVGNPVGGPGPGVRMRPGTPPPQPPPRPMKPLGPMSAAEFEQAMEQARGLPQPADRAAKLIALGYLLTTTPPR